MSGVLARLGAAFVAPAPPAPPPRCAPPAGPAVASDATPVAVRARRAAPTADVARAGRRVAVLSRPADAWTGGGAAGLALLSVAGATCAVVGVWPAEAPAPPVLAPATRAARRHAARLCARGHDARATGRLVVVALAGDAAEAAAEGVRLGSAAGDAPVVVVIAGPREPCLDALLADQDPVVVAAAEADPVAPLATSSLGRSGVTARCVSLAAAAPVRALAAAGIALVAPLRAATEWAVR